MHYIDICSEFPICQIKFCIYIKQYDMANVYAILSKYFIYQLMHNRVALKNIKIYIKTAPTCFGSITTIRERIIWAC